MIYESYNRNISKCCCILEVCYGGIVSVCRLIAPTLKPYLTYTIIIESSKLNIPKLSKKQLSLFDKISQFRDEGLTYKQISDKLNELGYEPTRGKLGEFTPQKVWSNYTKIKKNQERKVEVTSLEVDNVNLVWE